ncbi:hypothetical protein STRTUCAR8_08586 [Streptomyces turgidiscabies Car8]|uniref:Bacteriophage T5 Orf172 DNA-binding domain-containing protein n=1 Tax=Streptomyces turgidiscabies (strain Car8) TaxID=698760 RepID=L7F7U7_STRT8|nr:GIY-YIG nuclease family protein [Streptomyces turgidiscabies]ELP67663.1 hypothetical protein STRTUCAR8_08586 [Streptomyces turgidiscabies Car8]
MITAPQQLGRLDATLERVIRGIALAFQVGAAAVYLTMSLRPSAWRQVADTTPAGGACMWAFAVCFPMVWAAGLWLEYGHFYDRSARSDFRKLGLIGHVGALAVAVVGASASSYRIALWIVIGAVAVTASITWTAWMQTRLLPDEDQAVIDALLSREAAQRAAVFDASQREQRRERLAAVMAGLGYTLTDAPAQPAAPADVPAAKWTVPAGKHAPYVYFIRNGNRMKIGTTTDLRRRIRTLALRAENIALLFEGDQRREREFHKQFAEQRIGTTEWFAYEGDLADFVHERTALIAEEGKSK